MQRDAAIVVVSAAFGNRPTREVVVEDDFPMSAWLGKWFHWRSLSRLGLLAPSAIPCWGSICPSTFHRLNWASHRDRQLDRDRAALHEDGCHRRSMADGRRLRGHVDKVTPRCIFARALNCLAPLMIGQILAFDPAVRPPTCALLQRLQ